MRSIGKSSPAWLFGLTLAAVIFLAVPPGQRAAAFWCLLGLTVLSVAAGMAPWPRVRRAGQAAGYWLGPACLLLAATGIAARLLDRAVWMDVCGLQSGFASEIMEGREAVKVWLASQGLPIYTDLTGYPLLITLYGPLYYLLAALAAKVYGPGLFAARLVSVAAGIGLGAVAGLVSWRLNRSVAAALACAALVMATPTMVYAAHARPDVLVWLTLYAGVACLLAAMDRPVRTGPAFAGAVVLLTLAAFSKQSTWPFIAAALVFLLWKRESRQLGVRLSLCLGIACAVCLAVMQWATAGEFLRQTILFPGRMSGLSSYNSFASAGERFLEFVRGHWGLILVFTASLVARKPRLGVMEAMFLLGLAATVMVMRWWGASVNHFLGLAVLMLIEASGLFGRLVNGGRHGLAALVLVLVAVPLFSVSVPGGPDPCGTAQERDAAALLEERLQGVKGPVIMDVEGAYVFLGRPAFDRLRLYDAWETDFFDQTGLWSLPGSVLASDIRERRAAAFVDSRVFMSAWLARLVRTYYREDARIGRYTVFVPRDEAAILAFPGGAGSTDLMEAKGLKNWGSYLQPGEGQGELVLSVPLSQGVSSLRLVYFPRFTGEGQRMRVSIRSGGGEWRVLDELAFEKPPPGTGFENRREAVSPVEGGEAFLRFELTGGAQLWMTPRDPMLVYQTAGDLTADEARR